MALEREFGDRGLSVVGVLHEDGPLARAYQVRGLPETFVISPDGRVVSRGGG